MPRSHLRQIKAFIFLCMIAVASFQARAAGTGVTYQGRILKPDGSPISGASTQFKMQIRAGDSSNCLMYEELQGLDLRNTNGAFSVTINDGSGSRVDTTGLTLEKIFANHGSFSLDASTCTTGTGVYTPTSSDGRYLTVWFKDETMSTWEPIPPQKINVVPYAFDAKQVQGFTIDSLVRVAEADGTLDTVSPLSNARYTELLAIINGTTTQYSKAGQLGGVSIPATTSLTSGQVLSWNGSSWVAASVASGAGSVTSTMLASGAVSSTAIASGAVGTTAIANNVSINTSGSLGARDIKIYPAGSGTGFVEMQANSSIADGSSYLLKWPATAGSVNQVLTTDGFGVLSWAAPTTSSQWTTHSSNVSYDGSGNIGIGTTSPGYPLTVIGTAAFSEAIKTGNGSAANPSVTFINNDISGLFLPSLNNIALSTNGSERLRVDAAGNVGIGTTAPQSALQVMGSASFGQSSAATSNSLAAGNYSGTFAQNSVALGDHAATYGNNAFAFSTLQSTASGTASMVFGSNVRTGSGFASSGGDFSMAFGLGTAAGTTPMVTGTGSMGIFMGDQSGANISANNVMVVLGGNVGIGATTPTASLHLKGGTATASTAPLKFTAGTLLTTPEDGAMEYTSTGLYYTIGSIRYVIPTNTAAGNYSNVSTIGNSSGGITISPMGSNAVVINSAATSTSPTTGGLIVTGGAGVTGSLNASGNITSGGTITATTSAVIPQLYGSTTSAGNIKIDGTSDSTKGNVLLAAAGGVVGIGTTAPLAKLSVNSVTAGNSTDAIQKWAWGDHTEWGLRLDQIHTGSAIDYAFRVRNGSTADIDAIYIKSNGNIGIGTPAPMSPLHILNSDATIILQATNSTSYAGENIYDDNGHLAASFQYGNSSAAAIPNTMVVGTRIANAPLAFITGGTAAGASLNERMRIDASGNVGIGTTAPGYTLDVAGSVNAAAIKINGVDIGGIEGFTDSPHQNAAVGVSALSVSRLTSTNNTAVGFQALQNAIPASVYLGANTAVGSTAGKNLTTGTSNLFLGYSAGATTTEGNNNILIGSSAYAPAGTSSYFLNIGNTIYGDLVVGNVGIGTTSPSSPLTVNGIIESKSGGIKFPDGTTQGTAAAASAWTSYSLTVTPQTGSFGGLTSSARYSQSGKTVTFTMSVNITSVGSAAGILSVTLPTTPNSTSIVAGRENATTGNMLQGIISAGNQTMSVFTYNNGSPIGNGNSIVISGSYESQ